MNQYKRQISINQAYLKNIFLLGELFGISKDQIYFKQDQNDFHILKGTEKIGSIQSSKEGEVPSFLFYTEMGNLKGKIASKEEGKTLFSLSVQGKSYHFIEGTHTIRFLDDSKVKQDITCRFLKEEGPLFSLSFKNIDSILFGIYQSYFHSPLPYENVVVNQGTSYTYSHTKRENIQFEVNEELNTSFFSFQEISRKDPSMLPFLEKIHEQMQFGSLNLYENFVLSCFEEQKKIDSKWMLSKIKGAYQKKMKTN